MIGSGEPIVYLHGWGASIQLMTPITLDGYQNILVDFYGHGDTPRENRVLKLIDYVKSVESLLDHLRVRGVTVVGHSFGGRVAMRLSLLRPDLVSRIVLISSAGVRPRYSLSRNLSVLIYKFKKSLGLDVSGYGSEDYKRLEGVDRATFSNIVREDLTPYLRYIDKPTLLIWGDEDVDTPMYMARKLAKKIKGSTLVVLEGEGHFGYLYQPKRVRGIIRSFLRG